MAGGNLWLRDISIVGTEALFRRLAVERECDHFSSCLEFASNGPGKHHSVADLWGGRVLCECACTNACVCACVCIQTCIFNLTLLIYGGEDP